MDGWTDGWMHGWMDGDDISGARGGEIDGIESGQVMGPCRPVCLETLIGNLIVSKTKSTTQQIELMWKYYYYLCAYLIITISHFSN
jgi:hypothetical protein